jgi:hypothetical protein
MSRKKIVALPALPRKAIALALGAVLLVGVVLQFKFEPMPRPGSEFPVGFFENPCGDGHNAMTTLGSDDAGNVLYGSYYLADNPNVPWAVIVRRRGQSAADSVIYLDYDRDGRVDAKTTLDAQACDLQKHVKKAPVKSTQRVTL